MSEHVGRHNALCHSRCCDGADDGCIDTVFNPFSGKGLGKSNETHLCGAIVCLTKVALSQDIKEPRTTHNQTHHITQQH